MTRKQSPRRMLATNDFDTDRRSPKSPPLTLTGGHVDNPIGLEPLGNVIVTGNRNKSAMHQSAANRLGHGGAADARDVPVDDACELVKGHDRLGLIRLILQTARERPREIAAE